MIIPTDAEVMSRTPDMVIDAKSVRGERDFFVVIFIKPVYFTGGFVSLL